MKCAILIGFLLFYFQGESQSFEVLHTNSPWCFPYKSFETSYGYIIFGTDDLFEWSSYWNTYIDNRQASIVKLDQSGNQLSTDIFGEIDSIYYSTYHREPDDFIRDAIKFNGKIYAIGTTQSYGATDIYDHDFMLLKLDTNGQLENLWTISSPFDSVYNANSASVTLDGKIMGIGWTYHFSGQPQQGLIIIADTNGVYDRHYTIWQPGNCFIRGAQQCADGGFICGGTKTINWMNNKYQPFVLKIDSNGVLQWIEWFANNQYASYGGNNLIRLSDGNYAFTYAQQVLAPGASAYVWIYHVVKFDESGNMIWDKPQFYAFNGNMKIGELSDGRIMMAGAWKDTLGGNPAGFLEMCDANGDSLWIRVYDNGNTSFKWFRDVEPLSDGGFIMIGENYCCNYNPNLGYYTSSLWVVRTDSLGLITSVRGEQGPDLSKAMLGHAWPNPCREGTTVPVMIPPGTRGQLLLFDAVGRELRRIDITQGVQYLYLDTEALRAGTYTLALAVDGYRAGVTRVIRY